jgi:hypothetical protein
MGDEKQLYLVQRGITVDVCRSRYQESRAKKEIEAGHWP